MCITDVILSDKVTLPFTDDRGTLTFCMESV